MAEKACHQHSMWVDLTYSDDTQSSRDAAALFAYCDVMAFMKRLRKRATDDWKRLKKSGVTPLPDRPYVRFLCAGEQGDENGRCHWHLIIFSNFDLTEVGAFLGIRQGEKVQITDRRQMISTFRGSNIRLDWDLWSVDGHPIGYVCLHDVDQGGVSYVVSYVLKDQFTGEKSKDTMRESKSENFATGLFRMSKRPGIGHEFLLRKMEVLEASGSVLPSLNIKIPGFKGYWHPHGQWRNRLLWWLRALNTRRLWATGRDAPQWSTLLASCADNPSDMETLNGEIIPPEENPANDDYESPISAARKRAREAAALAAAKAARAGNQPCCCESCLGLLDEAGLVARGLYKVVAGKGREAEYWHEPDWPHGDPIWVWDVCKYEPDGPFG
ncbi:rolling circle replication-associated protein [Pseudogemmobacter humi]|nr:hypothetical protein [Pseudogemmobacter humi]